MHKSTYKNNVHERLWRRSNKRETMKSLFMEGSCPLYVYYKEKETNNRLKDIYIQNITANPQ